MIVPEGITIEGSIKGTGDTEIAGKVEGDVSIEGRMYIGGTAVITGSVRSTSCSIEGEVSGKIECKEDIELGQTGKLSSDITAGRRIDLAGQVFGNVSTPGVLRLGATSRVKGDLRVRNLVI
ncbi:MAG: polymer-forming cytoskeletal protein, partial [Candidatus Hydrogenedentes bacterium]|nr:polymer-forming cytoskeletal protein [Candidatus Hydrogenedentota bacterium]